MTKVKNLNSYPNLVLTISKFMANYYDIHEEKMNKFKHNELKEIFNFLEPVSLNEITKEKLVKGEIILVIDGKNNISGYNNPFVKSYYNDTSHNENKCSKVDIVFEIDNDIDVLEEVNEKILDNMNIYELEKLLKLCKDNQDLKGRRLVQKELYFRLDNHSSEKKMKKYEKVKIRELRKEDLL